MQVKPVDCDRLNELPDLAPPPELEASVLALALTELDGAIEAADPAATNPTPAVSGFEIFVHGTLIAAYVVYAAHVAIGMLDHTLAF